MGVVDDGVGDGAVLYSCRLLVLSCPGRRSLLVDAGVCLALPSSTSLTKTPSFHLLFEASKFKWCNQRTA